MQTSASKTQTNTEKEIGFNNKLRLWFLDYCTWNVLQFVTQLLVLLLQTQHLLLQLQAAGAAALLLFLLLRQSGRRVSVRL